ncbi:MAG: serine protease [Planctomycetota bacterium]
MSVARNTISWLAYALLCVAIALSAAGDCKAQCIGGICPTPGWRSAPPAVEQPTPATVCRVIARSPRGANFGTGTLVAIRSSRSYVLTCHHLFVDSSSGSQVVFGDGATFAARLVATDKQHDLALLEINPPNRRPQAVSSAAATGLLTAGGLGGDGRYQTITGPIIGYSTPIGAASPSIKLRGSVRSGDSGGPVLNAARELVGVVWGVSRGVSYAVVGRPITRLLSRIPQQDGAPQRDAQGMVRVTPRKPAGVAEDRIAKLEQRVDRFASCSCDGDCVKRSELEAFAAKTELQDLREAGVQQQATLLDRIRLSARETVNAARQAARQAAGQRLTELGGPLRSLSTMQVVLGALGIGGPTGLAVLAIGIIARRRLRKRLRRRGRGGPRAEPFPTRT